MPHMPIASYVEYEEPVVATGLAARSPRNATRRFKHHSAPTANLHPIDATDAAAAPPSSLSTQDIAQESDTTAKKRQTQQGTQVAEESLSNSRVGRVQRAEEYPRIAFKPLRELRQAATEERSGGVSPRRRRAFVFGLGSHGLSDHSAGHFGVAEEEAEGTKAGASPSSHLPPQGHVRRRTEAAKEASPTLRLPQLAPAQLAMSRQPTMSHTRRPLPPLPATVPLPSAMRTLRYGGVIDAFSYFSVHRVHPEMYAR